MALGIKRRHEIKAAIAQLVEELYVRYRGGAGKRRQARIDYCTAHIAKLKDQLNKDHYEVH